ncbi:MAG: TatD family hydrolase [Tannerellaceae bacterium]|nr:TatD family hydrolase [Tannerellaceae bacterium]
MYYYNIHTHRKAFAPEEIPVFSHITGKDLAEEPVTLYKSVGIHPWFIAENADQLQKFIQEAEEKNVIAIGEIGLDKRAVVPMAMQESVFREQLLFAEQLQKPVIIHCVKAWEELIALKKNINPSVSWIIHGFRGKPDLAEQLIKQNLYLSFGRHFNSGALQKAWPERCFAETDEENVSIREVYTLLADSLHISTDLLAIQLRQNVRRVFSI